MGYKGFPIQEFGDDEIVSCLNEYRIGKVLIFSLALE